MEVDKKAEIARLKKEIAKAKAGMKKHSEMKSKYMEYENAFKTPHEELEAIADRAERQRKMDMASDYRVGKIRNTKLEKGAKSYDINEGRMRGYAELLEEQLR